MHHFALLLIKPSGLNPVGAKATNYELYTLGASRGDVGGLRGASQNLALKIFTRNSPIDPEPLGLQCLECLDEGRAYQACTASGQARKLEK